MQRDTGIVVWLYARIIAFLPVPLFAAARSRPRSEVNTQGFWYYLAAGLLALGIVVGVMVAHRLWREAHEEDDVVSDEDLLEQFRAAYEAGEMDETEFRRVSELLTQPKPAPGQKPSTTAPAPKAPSESPPPVAESGAPPAPSETPAPPDSP